MSEVARELLMIVEKIKKIKEKVKEILKTPAS